MRKTFESVEDLELPKLGYRKNKGVKKDTWKLQTYEDFALKTEQQNPNTEFTKEVMDDAFRLALKRVKSWAPTSITHSNYERMLMRVSVEWGAACRLRILID